MTVARQVAWNTTSQAAARATAYAFALVATIILTRYLGSSEFGAFVTATIYASLFAVLADWGIAAAITRELARDWESRERLVSNALALRLVLSVPVTAVAALIVLIAYSGPSAESIRVAVLVALPTITITSVSTTLIAVFQARLAMARVAAIEVIVAIVVLGLVVAAVVADAGLNMVIAVTVVGALIMSASLAVLSTRLLHLRLRFDLDIWKRILTASLPIGVALVLGTLYFKVDAILLSVFKDADDVGIYGIAWRFLEMLVAFPAFFVMSVFPLLSDAAHQKAVDAIRQLLQRSFDVLVLMSVPVVLGTIALAPEIVNLLGGSEFSEAAAPLRIVMAGGGFLFLNAFLGASMVAIDRQRDLVVLNLVALSLNVALNVILIPPFGYIAAASVAAVSELAAFAGSLYLVHKRTSFRPRLSVTVRALIAGGVMFGVVWLVPVHFTISVLLGIAVYGVMTVVLGLHRAVELHTIFGSAGAG